MKLKGKILTTDYNGSKVKTLLELLGFKEIQNSKEIETGDSDIVILSNGVDEIMVEDAGDDFTDFYIF